MKRGLKILAIIVATFISTKYVKADTLIIPSEYSKENYEENINLEDINNIKKRYESNWKTTYSNYVIYINPNSNYQVNLVGVKNINQIEYKTEGNTTGININGQRLEMATAGGGIIDEQETPIDDITGILLNSITINNGEATSERIILYYYDSNINIKTNYKNLNYDEIEIKNFYNDNIIIKNNTNYPKLKDLINYNSWSDYENEHLEGYTEVNLDNYEYVLLSLKNYNQTQAFQTNLQVKGQIGITPIYNYGQTSKDSITGSQVQDRCNLSYSKYTSYPFYIIQSDLQNNAIYAVKECSQGSSFKFDNTVFDVTYVTEANKESPTVTINGKTYDVIPYQDLPSTATKNEEDNYIPGESGQANSTGGLDSAIKNVQQKMSEIWNTFTYFTNFVGQLFSTLPTEVRTILLSGFTIAIVLGLIKIFIGK